MQRVRVELIDDIDGSLIDDAGGTVQFMFDGQGYELDLSSANAMELRKKLEPYIAAARKSGAAGLAPAAAKRTPRREALAIREWAKANGYELDERGRIPGEVRAAYESSSRKSA